MVFAVLYLVVRGLWFPVVTLGLVFPDLVAELQRDRPHSDGSGDADGAMVFFAVAIGLFLPLQWWWAWLILRQVHGMLRPTPRKDVAPAVVAVEPRASGASDSGGVTDGCLPEGESSQDDKDGDTALGAEATAGPAAGGQQQQGAEVKAAVGTDSVGVKAATPPRWVTALRVSLAVASVAVGVLCELATSYR